MSKRLLGVMTFASPVRCIKKIRKKTIIAAGFLFLVLTAVLLDPGTSRAYTATYYSPRYNLQRIDIHWLKKARLAGYLYIAMYSFTDRAIARELIRLAKSGVKIYIYRDDRQMKDRTDVTRMLAGVRNIYIEAKNDRGFWNIMHDKMFIIPGVVLREGSANWSPSAEGASCWNGYCGPGKNQDNDATYITNPAEINRAMNVFREMWGRRSNLTVYPNR